MRGADEHLHEVVVEGVVELALELPGELRAIQIAGMDGKNVGVDWVGGIFPVDFQVDEDLDQAVRFAGVEGEQRVIVKAQVIENLGELR